jgi:hypothetical protein
MKLDPEPLRRKLGGHIPGFAGYGAPDYLQTDLLLRRFLAGKVEEVRDRLADLIAARGFTGELHEKAAASLKTAAFLKDETTPVAGDLPEGLSPTFEEEERLLDFDLVLVDKVAALHTPLDLLEAADAAAAVAQALDLFDEGVAEVDELLRRRWRQLRGEAR